MGKVKTPYRPKGYQKPILASFLGNYDCITDFLSQRSNANNEGLCDIDNMDSWYGAWLGINATLGGTRRRSILNRVLLSTTDAGLPSNPTGFDTYITNWITQDLYLVNFRAWGTSKVASGASGNNVTLDLTIDGTNVGEGGQFFISNSAFQKEFYTGAPVATDPSPSTSAQFQFRSQASWVTWAGFTQGYHTFGVRVGKTNSLADMAVDLTLNMEFITETYAS